MTPYVFRLLRPLPELDLSLRAGDLLLVEPGAAGGGVVLERVIAQRVLAENYGVIADALTIGILEAITPLPLPLEDLARAIGDGLTPHRAPLEPPADDGSRPRLRLYR